MSLLPPVSYVPLDASAATEAEDKAAVEDSVSTVAASELEDKSAVQVSVTTVAAMAVATGHLALKIEGYSWIKEMHGGNGSYIESSAVEVGGHTWRIRCYLNGNNKEHAGWVSLFLHLCSDSVVRAEYELALVRQHGPWPEHGPQCALIMSDSLRTFDFEGKDNYSGWGYPRFITPLGLEDQYIEADYFTVRCTVTLVEERTEKDEVVVQADDMARLMGMLCECDDDRCKREHARPGFFEIIANFCYSICCGGHAK